MNFCRFAVASLATVVALSACGGGGGSGMTPAPSVPAAPPPYSGPQSLANFTYGANAMQGAQYVGPAKIGTMGVDVSLKLQNPGGLASYAQQVSTPGSGNYRRFLTPQQIGARFGASQADLTTAATYFAGYHLHVGTWPQHLSLFVAGPQHALEQAFGTKFGIYRHGSQTFIAPSAAPHFAKALAVVGVSRLVTAQRQFSDHLAIGEGDTTSGYAPQQVRNVFDYTGSYNAGYTGSGIHLGIIGTGPISTADVPAYASMFNTNVASVTQVDTTDNGIATAGNPYASEDPTTGFATPPPVTPDCSVPNGAFSALPGCNPEDVEAQLDTEQAASLAPGSSVLFYLAYNPSWCTDNSGNFTPPPCTAGQQATPLEGIEIADDEIQQAIADNTADVLSLSYGGSEAGNATVEFDPTTLQGIGPSEFAALAAEGIAVFVSSGDSGAEGCQSPVFLPEINQACVSYPAGDPNVTSVGGTTVPLDRFGNLTNQITGWGYMTNQGVGGSGGGVSQYFPQTLTPWQQGIPGVTGSNRNQPDVSLLGDSLTGVTVLLNAAFGNPEVGSVGGTSVAAPEMAAMWALVLQACKQSPSCSTATGAKPYRLGNAAPVFYKLYAIKSQIQPTYAQTFYDVVYGNNQMNPNAPSPGASPLDPGYNAGPGYDQVTGIGVPFARALIKAVTKQ